MPRWYKAHVAENSLFILGIRDNQIPLLQAWRIKSMHNTHLHNNNNNNIIIIIIIIIIIVINNTNNNTLKV